MATGRDIVIDAMRLGGIITQGETPPADEINSGITRLNDMLGSWSTNFTTIYVRAWESFNLTGGVGTYTIGVGQDFNTARPNHIAAAYLRNGVTDYPVTVFADEDYYDIGQKNTQGNSYWLNYDNGYPVGKIRLFPVPSTTFQLFLLSEKSLATLTLDSDVLFPPGWERAIKYNLAVEFCGEFGQPVPAKTEEIADSSLGDIRRAVLRARSMDWSPGRGVETIYTGWFY